MTLRVGALCAGYGGLEMATSAVLDARPAWFCEKDDGPSSILAHHWPALPNHRDLTTTDWDTVEPVDIVTAGWPCQPFSVAGTRKGSADARAIWPAIADAVRALRPRYVLLENVARVVAVGELARAAGALADLGYVGAWRCLRASDIGAPHRRERCFVAADSPRIRHDRGGAPRVGRAGPTNSGDVAANTTGNGWDEGRTEPTGQRAADWGKYGTAVTRWERILGRSAPAPTEPGARGGQRLSAAFVEWMMGLPAGWVTDVPNLSRNQQLKALGNGVVPQQAAAAYADLLTADPGHRAR